MHHYGKLWDRSFAPTGKKMGPSIIIASALIAAIGTAK
jgi:hypothetical protein